MPQDVKRPRPLSLKIVVFYKAVLGLVEVVFGATFIAVALGVQNVTTNSFIHTLVAKELVEDPNDIFIHWLLTHNFPIALRTAMQISVLVLLVGIVKLAVAYGIWKHSHRAQVASLILVGGLGLAGIFDIIFSSFGWFKLIATAVDIILFYYLAWVMPKHFPLDSKEELL